MDATPITFDAATPLDGSAIDPQDHAGDAIARRWAALHDAAAVVAALAGGGAEAAGPRGFPAAVSRAAGVRRELAEQGIDDLAAIMEPGLAALIAVHAGGGNPAAPARALWQEFVSARDALCALVLPRG